MWSLPQKRATPGSARARKRMVEGDWTLISAPPLPQEPIHFVSMPRACFEWGGAWNGVSAEASPNGPEPSSVFLLLLNDSSRLPRPWRRMNDRGRLYVRVLIRPLHGGKWEGTLGRSGEGVLLLSIHWGENWSMQVSDVGFNVCRERERGPSAL